jgi:hypothetical protein
VGDEHQSARKLEQALLEDVECRDVEIVGGLVRNSTSAG